MRSLLLLATALSVALSSTLSSCSDPSSGTIELLPMKMAESGKWVLVNADGEIAIDSLHSAPSMAINGYFTVADSSGISIRSASGEPTPASFESLVAAGVMTEGRIPAVRPNQRISLLDSQGDSISTLMPIDGHEIDAVSPFFSSGRMIVHIADGSVNGQYGAIDRNGQIVIQPAYDCLFPFHGNYALARRDSVIVTQSKKKAKAKTSTRPTYSLLDRNGNTTITFPDGMIPLSEGVWREVMPVSFNDTLGFVNIRGSFIAAPKSVKKIHQATDRSYVYSVKSGRKGVLTIEGDTIIAPDYSDILIVDDSHFIVSDKDATPILINSSADTIFEFAGSDRIISLADKFPFSSKIKFIGHTPDNTYIIYDDNGNRVTTQEFEDISTWMINTPIFTASGEMLSSDYFDLKTAANKFIAPLTSAGYGKAKIGFTCKALTNKAPEKLTSQQSLLLLSTKGHRYDITATAYTEAPITTATPIYKEKDDIWSFFEPDEVVGHNYEYNPKAVIKKIIVKLSTESVTFAEINKLIRKDITDKNYKLIEETQTFSIYQRRSGKHYIVVTPQPMQKGIELNILSSSAYSSLISSLKRNADINFSLG